MTVEVTNFWSDNYYNHPVLTNDMIEFAEASLMVKLPLAFIELLTKQNGGNTKGFVFPLNEATGYFGNQIPLTELFGIVPDKTIETSQNILDTYYMTEEWGLPEKQVLLSGEGHWWITLDYRMENNPTVRWIDVECNEDIHIADCFEDFINGLVYEDTYTDINGNYFL